jgi:hypothetical protein
MGARINQTTPRVATNEFAAEDESITTNKAAAVVPLLIGEGKTTIRWLSPIYGQRVVNLPSNSGGKGGKGGGGTTRKEYHGTIAGAIGEGPGYSLEWIIAGGKLVWSGSLVRSGEDYVDITLTGVGAARLYWGTETQTADPTLTAYEDHPAYRSWVYLVLKDCSWGENTGPLTIEVGWRKQPQQLIVTGGPVGIDGNATAVPASVAAELLTSWSWGNLPAEKLNAESFQAVADSLYVEGVPDTNRIRTSIAPLYNEQTTLRTALADIASVAKVWIRLGVDGRIEAGRWRRDGDLSNVAALTWNDVESAKFDVEASDELPNSFAVEFRDAMKHHKVNLLTVDNTAAVRSTGKLRRQSANRASLLIHVDQAEAHGTDLLVDSATPGVTVTLSCRRWKAVLPDGTPIRPGDYFTFPMEEQGEAADVRLFRCVRRSFGPTGPIELTGEREKSAALRNVTPYPAPVEVTPVTPPLNYSRIVAISPEFIGDPQGVRVLAARPTGLAYAVDVQYSATVDGDYAYIGTQKAFALPLTLVQSLSDSATTIRVKLITGSNGIDARRDASLLLNWNGGEGEAGNNTLVLCLVKKDGGGNIVPKANGKPWVEVVSVAAPPSAVATDTYDVSIIRGRSRTLPAAFTTGSFPDNWANYEVWCIPIDGLTNHVHLDFPNIGAAEDPGYFRLIPISRDGAYDPDLAWAERQRRVAESLDLIEFDPQTSGGVYYPEVAVAMPNPTVTPPTNLVLTSGATTVLIGPDGFAQPRLVVTWDAPDNPDVQEKGYMRVEFARPSLQWAPANTLLGDQTELAILGLEVGVEYRVRVRSELNAVPSEWVVSDPHELVGDLVGPSALTGVTATAYPGYIRVSWPASTALDIGEYKVYRGTSISFGSATEIAETPGLVYDDPDVVSGTTYRYWVQPVDRSENETVTASNRADETAIDPPLSDETPSNPTAATKTAEGSYLSGDGRLLSYITLSVPALPSGAARQNVLLRLATSGEYQIAAQLHNTSTASVRIDDLTPDQVYYIGTQSLSATKKSSVVAATGSPFTAAFDTPGPEAPTSATFIAGNASTNAAPPVLLSGSLAYAMSVQFTESTSPHVLFYVVIGTTANSDTAASLSADSGGGVTVPRGVGKCSLYATNTTDRRYVRIRACAKGSDTTVVSDWYYAGDASSYFQKPAGSLTEQNANAVTITGGSVSGITDIAVSDGGTGSSTASGARSNLGLGTIATQADNDVLVSGIKTGSSGASQVKVRQIGEAGVTLTGGAVDERKNVTISGKGFSTKPDHGTAWATSNALMLVSYDKLNGSSTSSIAVFYFQMKDGSNLPSGSVTFTYELIEI